ncbi:unnamed protein product [Blepharisma stoltei]|uniref:Uncharacterized protein n=1 Tax=Blepharisma stoltei TaxID=1481888 RepID=A0AAU9JJG4_9CILI|nr:unnamed protein product [Blepharisma stoltei]
MCPIPGDKLFGLSNNLNFFKSSCSVFIIDEEKLNLQFIQKFSLSEASFQRGPEKIIFSIDEDNALKTFLIIPRIIKNVGTYYNNFFYISMKDILGFDLVNQRWHAIVKSEEDRFWCSSLSFNNSILALEYEREEIYSVFGWFSWDITRKLYKWPF